MHHEHGVCRIGVTVEECFLGEEDIPFGDHFGPRTQSGGARPLGQAPAISLFRSRALATTNRTKQLQTEGCSQLLTLQGSGGPTHEGPDPQERITSAGFTTV